MPCFTFEETCTSRPLYEVEANTLEEAATKYQNGTAYLREEPVEENYLIDVRREGKSIITEAERLGLSIYCEACQSVGPFISGVPGILANMEHGRLAPGSSVERCDACERFESDEAALAHLRQRGMA